MPFSPLFKQLARRTGMLFVIFLVAKILPAVVDFPVRYEARIDRVLEYTAVIAIFLQASVWVSVAVNFWAGRYAERHNTQVANMTTIQAVSIIVKLVLWAILALTAFDQLGKNITGIIAGLGVGGIAIAFALQNILGDLFAALSIITDKPFVIGDTIQVEGFVGRVERIGVKSTRIRSESGEQIIIGNGDLLKGRIRNYGRMQERRATFETRITATTATDKLALVPSIIRDVVVNHPETRFVRSTLTGIGDSTVNFNTVYYLTDPAYQLYADTQQDVLLELIRRLRAADIPLAAQLETAVKEQDARSGRGQRAGGTG